MYISDGTLQVYNFAKKCSTVYELFELVISRLSTLTCLISVQQILSIFENTFAYTSLFRNTCRLFLIQYNCHIFHILLHKNHWVYLYQPSGIAIAASDQAISRSINAPSDLQNLTDFLWLWQRYEAPTLEQCVISIEMVFCYQNCSDQL